MFLIQHTKYPQRVFVAYAHLYYRLFEQTTKKRMLEASKNLDFQQAAQYRDEMLRLQDYHNID